MFLPLFSSLVALPAVLGAALIPKDTIACVHNAANRSCWSDGFDISTNYYEKVPDTGVVREYWLNIENTTAAPDGFESPAQLINGSFPGPTIIADWGDTVGTCSSSLSKLTIMLLILSLGCSCTCYEFPPE